MGNVKHYTFDIEDHGGEENVTIFFTVICPQIHAIIDQCMKNKEGVLIHCQAGKSRSASAIISWFMMHNMSYADAFQFVKRRRPVINPNLGFVDYMKNMK
jgi:protein-tyrosine phosphatase